MTRKSCRPGRAGQYPASDSSLRDRGQVSGPGRAGLAAAVEIAESLGVDRLVIGLTIVTLGTSMPELATSVIAALRGEREIP